MTTTFTDDQASDAHGLDLANTLNNLQKGKLILYPTDTVWSIGCDATQADAVHRLRATKPAWQPYDLEILVSSVEMLKEYILSLHPRLETLLLHHTRPLSVVYGQGKNLPAAALDMDGSLVARVVQDQYCAAVIRGLKRPIVAVPADLRPGYYPTSFGTISSDVVEQVDYVTRYGRTTKQQSELSVMARLDEKDELEFLRD